MWPWTRADAYVLENSFAIMVSVCGFHSGRAFTVVSDTHLIYYVSVIPHAWTPSILHDALELQQLKLGLRWSGDSQRQEFMTARCKYMLHCR